MHNWTATCIVTSTLLLVTAGLVLWKKKKRQYVHVGKISQLLWFPVKSLKGIKVEEGMCTSLGFAVNGLLDRTFMAVDSNGKLVSQREEPSLVKLTPYINGKTLTILEPTGQEIIVNIKDSISQGDKILRCFIHTDSIDGVDCGDEAALFFQSYLNRGDVRLVQHFPSLPKRKYLKNDPFRSEVRIKHPIGFQDFSAFHLLSQASIENLNFNLEETKVSGVNFRPNILVEGCKAFEEDTWEYLKFHSGAVLSQVIPTPRCIMTTNDPCSGVLTKKEPLLTMRKYRIPKSPKMLKKTGSIPCFGVSLGVYKALCPRARKLVRVRPKRVQFSLSHVDTRLQVSSWRFLPSRCNTRTPLKTSEWTQLGEISRKVSAGWNLLQEQREKSSSANHVLPHSRCFSMRIRAKMCGYF